MKYCKNVSRYTERSIVVHPLIQKKRLKGQNSGSRLVSFRCQIFNTIFYCRHTQQHAIIDIIGISEQLLLNPLCHYTLPLCQHLLLLCISWESLSTACEVFASQALYATIYVFNWSLRRTQEYFTNTSAYAREKHVEPGPWVGRPTYLDGWHVPPLFNSITQLSFIENILTPVEK